MKVLKGLLTAVVCGLAAVPAGAATLNYVTTLSGANEDPPNASPGTGSGTVSIDTIAKTMEVYFEFADLLGTLTVAHIHGPTEFAGAGTAGVMTTTPTFPGAPAGVTSGTYSNVFDMTEAASFRPGFITLSGGTVDAAFDALLAALAEGKAYLNLHSSVYGAGEIRGFLVPPTDAPIPLPGAVWLMLAGTAALVAAGRRRAG
jgi:hypothetical protein